MMQTPVGVDPGGKMDGITFDPWNVTAPRGHAKMSFVPEEPLSTVILREIRDELRATRTDLGGLIQETNARLDQTNARLDQTNLRLERVEETLRDLAAQQLMLTRYVKNVVDRHEEAIADLRERLARIEAKQGSR